MMIITNAGNDDLFQSGNMSSLIRHKMTELNVSESPLEITKEVLNNQKKLYEFISKVESSKELPLVIKGGWSNKSIAMTKGTPRKKYKNPPTVRDRIINVGLHPKYKRMFMRTLDGVTYDMDDIGVGIMPLLMQVMHNNYTEGISSIGFSYDATKDSFYMLIKEGEVLHKIRCSDRKSPHYYNLDEHGEIYRVCVISEFSSDEYNRPVLRNEFYFVEDSTVRVMNIYFAKREPLQHDYGFDVKLVSPPENIGVRFDEVPGSGMLLGIIDQFGSLESFSGINGLVVGWLSEYGAMDALTLAIRDTVRPKLHGKLHEDVENSDGRLYDGDVQDSTNMISDEAITEDD